MAKKVFLINTQLACNASKDFNSTFFGHIFQGTKSGGEMESAQAKNQALRDAGAVVPTSYEAFEGAIKEAFDKLVGFSLFILIADFNPV